MKTTQNRRNKVPQKTKKPFHFRKDSDALAVLRDISNGKEYFLSVIDTFPFAGREYVVMYNYEPDDGNHSDPEIVIMRSEFSDKGIQCFYSVTGSRELNNVFERFVDRLASNPDKSGVKS